MSNLTNLSHIVEFYCTINPPNLSRCKNIELNKNRYNSVLRAYKKAQEPDAE